MAVVIVTNEQDLGADYVVLELERRGVPVLRCNAERLPQWRVSLRPGHGWELRDARGRSATSHDTSGVWWRRPERPAFDARLSAGEQQALVDQWQAFAEGLASVTGPVWISPPSAIAAAEDKAMQLTAAREVGFATPETLWTNDLVEAREMVMAGAAVLKTVTAAHWEDGDAEAAFVFTHGIDPTVLPQGEHDFAAAPAAFQRRVAPKRDVRVTVVGETVLAGETATDAVDWRLEPATPWSPHILPPDASARCSRLVDALGLRFGGIDLALDDAGTYWFLEINPNGEWGWQQRSGLPIASALADALTHGGA